MRRAAAIIALGAALVAGPARADEPAVEQRGELLFHIGGCTNCHTAKNGQLLAGGDPIVSPYGTFFAPNITPDPETGIGGWTEAQFVAAMRHGRAPDGSPYYPAFPYTSYTRMTEADLGALKAYLDTVPPVNQASKPHELGFPYNQRWGLNLWQWLFFTPEEFAPDPAKDAAWNEGAYLVLGPGHCGECHTPRNVFGALEWDHAFAGATLGKEKIPDITPNPDGGLGKWSTGDLATFLKLGMTPDGDFVGSEMAKVVNNGTSKLPEPDLGGIVAYLQSLPPS